MATETLSIIIRARDAATSVFTKFSSFLRTSFFVGIAAVTTGFTALTGAMIKGVSAAKEQELATSRLNAALVTTGQYSAEASKKLHENAAALQQVTTFGDETILEVQKLLLIFGKLSVDQIPAATKATLGFAAAQGIDVKSAASLVAKSIGSSTNALQRYSIEIDTTASQTEKFRQVTEKLIPLFALAEAEANTFEGRIKQIKNAFGDQLETLGFGITKNKEFNATLKEILVLLQSPDVTSGLQSVANFVASITALAVDSVGAVKRTLDDFREFGAFVKGVFVLDPEKYLDQLDQVAEKQRIAAEQAKNLNDEHQAQVELQNQVNQILERVRSSREALANLSSEELTIIFRYNAALADQIANQQELARVEQERIKLAQVERELAAGLLSGTLAAGKALGLQLDIQRQVNRETEIGKAIQFQIILEQARKRGLITDLQLLEANQKIADVLQGRVSLASLAAKDSTEELTDEMGNLADTVDETGKRISFRLGESFASGADEAKRAISNLKTDVEGLGRVNLGASLSRGETVGGRSISTNRNDSSQVNPTFYNGQRRASRFFPNLTTIT